MAILGLVLVFVWILLVGVVRSYSHLQRTGETGMRFGDPRGSPQWWSRRISSLGFLFTVGAPLADLAGMPEIALLAHPAFRAVGVALVASGIAVTIVSQVAMGASWRGDVDSEALTEFVTTGPFRSVRNPTFAGTVMTSIGLMLVVPNALSVAMLSLVIASLQVQVRLVEEPYLLRVHGDAYRRYAARTGRFFPGIGRLKGRMAPDP